LSVPILLAIYGLLPLAFRSRRHAMIVLVNLPLAPIGGVLAVAASGKGFEFQSPVAPAILGGLLIRRF
jgi:Cu/Ag efflux pump CusA